MPFTLKCHNCGVKQITHAKIGSSIQCKICKKTIFVFPEYDDVPQFEKAIVVPEKKLIEVEVQTVPLWLLILQGVQIACLISAILWVSFSNDKVLLEIELAKTKLALQKLEKDEALKYGKEYRKNN